MLRHSSQEVGAPRQESPISTHARTARCTTALSQHSPPSPPQPTPSPPSPCRRRHCCRCPRPCRLRTRPRHRRTCSPRPSARTRPRHRRTCSPRPSAHDGRRCTRTRSHTRARTCTQPAFSACASDAPRLACVRYRVKNLPRRVLKTGVCRVKTGRQTFKLVDPRSEPRSVGSPSTQRWNQGRTATGADRVQICPRYAIPPPLPALGLVLVAESAQFGIRVYEDRVQIQI